MRARIVYERRWRKDPGRMAAEIVRAGFTKLMGNDEKPDKMEREDERGIR